MRILSIETSCDETSLAVVDCHGGLASPRFKIEKEIITSQIKIHAPWGGVVPFLAKREHVKNLPIIFGRIAGIPKFELPIPDAKNKREFDAFFKKIDAIAVTVGPGLEPALWTGITFAKELSKLSGKPLIGANHMEGHLYSPLLSKRKESNISALFPAVALIVSGGHTMLLKMGSLTKWKKLGETRDDATGEAFDKVARLLNLPYPGGPQVSKCALKGKVSVEFPRPMIHSGDFDFSFSGLKTAVLYHLQGLGYRTKGMPKPSSHEHSTTDPVLEASSIPAEIVNDISASFEAAAVDVLTHKTFKAVDKFEARSVWLAGGVAANKALRRSLTQGAKKRGAKFFVPDMKHNTDNGAMIAAAAYIQTLKNKKRPLLARGDLGV